MVGIIRRREQIKIPEPEPFDPLVYFDANDTCTEEDFITILEHGCYDSRLIGKYVILSNSVDYNNGKYIIADVNHDSENTGQSNCYDLISVDLLLNSFTYRTASSSSAYTRYFRDSYIRSWLNNTFYPGYSTDFKSHVMNIKYNSNSSWYADDKVIVPSYTEVNGNVPSDYSFYTVVEGTKYPIFNAGSSSRVKYTFGTPSTYYWWTRSLLTIGNSSVWIVSTGGDMSDYLYDNNCGLAPLLRVS